MPYFIKYRSIAHTF